MIYMPRKPKENITARSVRLTKDVVAMLELYANDQDWSANAALNNALKRYLTGLGYQEKVEEKERSEAVETSTDELKGQ